MHLAQTWFTANVVRHFGEQVVRYTTDPDFGSSKPGAVAPKSDRVVAYHEHAKRVEDAGLAAPYEFVTKSGLVTDTVITAAGLVDPSRAL